MYDDAYFKNNVERSASEASDVIAESIVREFKPASCIDVGCGTGALLSALRDRGVEVFGIESANAGLEYCAKRGVHAAKFDIETDEWWGEDQCFDLAISMEVAEHLRPAAADTLVALLCRIAPRIVFTAAFPGQGGVGHINEQPRDYWMGKFVARGFAHSDWLARQWARSWKQSGRVAFWYTDNLMVFTRP